MLEGVPVAWAGERDGLIGRDAVLARLRELLLDGGRTVTVTGIAGAGKTSVLTAAARGAAAEGWQVFSLACQAGDQDLVFGTLLELVSTAPGAEAILESLLPSVETPVGGDPLRLRLELVEWLTGLGTERPVLLVVDDVQWCDASSLSVLGFLARRLQQTSVSFLAAARGEPPVELERHPGVQLPPLTQQEARAVLRQAGLTIDRAATESVVEHAEGIPLALLEFGRSVVDGGSPGSIPPSVETAFSYQLAQLPATTRGLLLLASASNGDLLALGRVLDPTRMLEDLAPAEVAGLVSVTERRIRFRHPLARAAAYSVAPAAERIHAHALLARAYADDPARQIWHRAEAAVAPDEEVASALAEAAERSRARGACTEAARLMTRAAELTPSRPSREERELEASALNSVAGNFDLAIAIAGRLRDGAEDPSVRARAGQKIGYDLAQTQRHDAARMVLLDGLETVMRIEPAWAWSSLTTLAVLDYRSGGGPGVVSRWLDRFDREMGPSPIPEIDAAARTWVRVQVDPLDCPADIVRGVREAPVPEHYPLQLMGSHEMMLGAAAWLLGEPLDALTRLGRAVDLMRRASAPGEISQTLVALALVQFETGAYDEVEATCQLVADLADARGLSTAALDALDLRARTAAIRGDLELARELCDQVLLDLHVGEYVALEANVRTTMSWVRAAERDPQGAWDEVRWLFRADGEPRHAHICYRDLGNYVATAVRARAGDQLVPVLKVAGRRLARAGEHYQLQLARARALLAGEDAEPMHRAAVTHPRAAERPFELANAQLEYGAWLRRRHRRTEAREQLGAALMVFDRLGARAWSDLAAAELRAAGVAGTVGDGSAWAALTGQEREIVRLAATGMTNREIAATLYLSPKTVSTHLYNAFPKLGVASRGQLREVVAGLDPA